MEAGEHAEAEKPGDCKYEPTPIPDGWKLMRGWKLIEEKTGWRRKGNCPRCGHEMSKFFPDRVGVLEMLRIDAVRAEDDDEDTVRCNCLHKHEGREPTKLGCGAYWGIVAVRKDAATTKDEA